MQEGGTVVPDTSKEDLVRGTWALAALDPERTSRAFYANLFRIDPTTKPLFVGDLTLQGRKLAETLNFIVDHLEESDILLPAALDLAQRHVGYGVVKEQYTSVGAALITTLEQLLGPTFTDAHKQAWLEIYTSLSKAMTDKAYAAQAPDT